ncbi:hypothetical protein ZIOFF_031421 [Zingiber officinale]|uniref:Peroxin-13 n=1 Tax=Zingiber officinale TaxID=94328 RepID=A0A8J5LAR6_ZINOF|nr:hypothetical protein ZIOFF_031421 [Zingiber officinale]
MHSAPTAASKSSSDSCRKKQQTTVVLGGKRGQRGGGAAAVAKPREGVSRYSPRESTVAGPMRVHDSSAPAPFEPPSSGSTSHVVEASDTPKPGEVAPIVDTNVTNTNNTLTRPVPPRLWQNYGTSYGGYGSSMYNSSYGSGMYDVRCCEFLLSNFYTNRSEYSGLSLVHGRSSPD